MLFSFSLVESLLPPPPPPPLPLLVLISVFVVASTPVSTHMSARGTPELVGNLSPWMRLFYFIFFNYSGVWCLSCKEEVRSGLCQVLSALSTFCLPGESFPWAFWPLLVWTGCCLHLVHPSGWCLVPSLAWGLMPTWTLRVGAVTYVASFCFGNAVFLSREYAFNSFFDEGGTGQLRGCWKWERQSEYPTTSLTPHCSCCLREVPGTTSYWDLGVQHC